MPPVQNVSHILSTLWRNSPVSMASMYLLVISNLYYIQFSIQKGEEKYVLCRLTLRKTENGFLCGTKKLPLCFVMKWESFTITVRGILASGVDSQ
ncbi:hypothetical protein B9L19_16410 [Geobacillus thermocatenulatus]|uniref:Uncharacterized protein n=1 Tax=Geobacillus thermocatenulatus TaxID=33938 RepID=A0A226Q3T9_9BACL|nr:hypothetical protein GT3921_17470 [Geobacillus thermocatenulatus]KLR75132.1 hypothetical protein ABH20_01865 [Geobacillus sp. T6]OXB87021.1 hypothetical protein B9L19_16410 [Geobacillus thermocatenulatus]RAN30505.1 hypothetical protein VC88_02480 [Geobacillus sp. A8]